MDNSNLLTPQQMSAMANPTPPVTSAPNLPPNSPNSPQTAPNGLLTTDQMAQMASHLNPANPTGAIGSSWDAFDKAVAQSSTSDGNPIVNFAKGVIAPVTNFGGEMAAGSTVGQNIESDINKSNQQASNSDYNLLKMWNTELQQAVKNGDTARATQLKSNLANFRFQDGTKMTDVFPNINDTNEQVIGNAIGTGLLAMSGGGLEAGGEAVAGAAKGTQTLTQAIKTGALYGTTFGAIGGGANAMANNGSAANVAGNTVLGGVVGAGTGAITGGLIHGGTALVKGAAGLLRGASEEAASDIAGTTAKQVQSNIDAVNSDLSGKKLTTGYKNVVTGGREVTPSSIFGEQGLTPDQQTINLGKRLSTPVSDVGTVTLTNDPVKNLDVLGSSLDKTEAKIDTLLKGDPELNYNADKPTLSKTLETLKTQAPDEFKTSIKDNNNLFNKVVNFAQKVLGNTDDTIEGLRDGRTAFDTQAKSEYPNAFKNGQIDTSTPQGRAIKMVRDAWNAHIYNTAPNGSEIQALIGREADIFRATDSVAAKAAQGHGLNSIQQLIQKYPKLSKALGYGAVALGGGYATKALGLLK